MSASVISVHNLGKRYRLGATLGHDTLRDHLTAGARALLGSLRPGRSSAGDSVKARRDDEFWALKDVSFEVRQGEVVGIIGRNGAGKSTLLKILSQITEPTEGEIRVRGRVASLLEVGTGFHPELSGRENVYLNGAVLGMTKKEIDSKFDEIVEFSGVERFLDTPVKRYSSGMYVRLAFAVAAHLEPEILVIDEVLAVGDAEFQKKCLGKMRDVAGSGRTVLFVSHNIGAVRQLCGKAVYLRDGSLRAFAEVDRVTRQYMDELARESGRGIGSAAVGDADDFYIAGVEYLDMEGRPQHALQTWDGVRIRVHFHCPTDLAEGSVVLSISSLQHGLLSLLSTRPDHAFDTPFKAGMNVVDCVIDGLPFAAGEYRLGVNLAIPDIRYLCDDFVYQDLTILRHDVYGSGRAPSLDRYGVALAYRWEGFRSPQAEERTACRSVDS